MAKKPTTTPFSLEAADDFLQAKAKLLPANTKSRDDMSIDALAADMPDLDDQRRWQAFVMSQNFALATSPDPDIKAKALERLAKTSVVGLYETKVSVNINTLPVDEIQAKLEKLVNRINEKTINHAP